MAEEVEQELAARDENMRTDLMARLNQMARIIREKAVPLGELCLQMNLAPATMYQYARAMKNVFLDIKFENGVFIHIPTEHIQQVSGQKELESS
ncbi:hypothetical protein MUP05_06170 [Candidatus Bathyarchaeota archaeon]|nr:hypothetical protein [Candidatus Bathyarchaeota archaeon]